MTRCQNKFYDVVMLSICIVGYWCIFFPICCFTYNLVVIWLYFQNSKTYLFHLLLSSFLSEYIQFGAMMHCSETFSL